MNAEELTEKKYLKTCGNCRKEFESNHQAKRYCSEACQNSKRKRRKGKSKSDKRYRKKHDVTRSFETSSRRLARKIAMAIYPCKCFASGKVYHDWKFLQIHHIDGNPFNNNPKNLIPLSPTEHAKIPELDYTFGETYENGDIAAAEQIRKDFAAKVEEVIKQLEGFKFDYGKPLPKFNEK